jgi:hypothetical protein
MLGSPALDERIAGKLPVIRLMAAKAAVPYLEGGGFPQIEQDLGYKGRIKFAHALQNE